MDGADETFVWDEGGDLGVFEEATSALTRQRVAETLRTPWVRFSCHIAMLEVRGRIALVQ